MMRKESWYKDATVAGYAVVNDDAYIPTPAPDTHIYPVVDDPTIPIQLEDLRETRDKLFSRAAIAKS